MLDCNGSRVNILDGSIDSISFSYHCASGPSNDDNEEHGSLEVNTLVSMEEEDDIEDQEEDVKPNSERDYVTVCSTDFPSMSSYSSSASNSCL